MPKVDAIKTFRSISLLTHLIALPCEHFFAGGARALDHRLHQQRGEEAQTEGDLVLPLVLLIHSCVYRLIALTSCTDASRAILSP
jgi:hypothetical protein